MNAQEHSAGAVAAEAVTVIEAAAVDESSAGAVAGEVYA